MQEQDNVRDVLRQASQALNNKENKSRYFDLHDGSLITHGIPSNFPANKEGMRKYYSEVWRAFPDANFEFEHVIVEGNEARMYVFNDSLPEGRIYGCPT